MLLLAFPSALAHPCFMQIQPDDVIGVLVTYQPDEAVAARIKQHLQQLNGLIVIENGVSSPANVLRTVKNITLLTHADNNLADAQNLGIRTARERGATAVLLLDDDSDMSEGMLAALCKACEPQDGLIAPQVTEGERKVAYYVPWLHVLFAVQRPSLGKPLINSISPIASGSLIPINVFDAVGLMDESFVIDYIDREFCLRLLTRGYQTKVIAEASLSHQIGRSEARQWLGKTWMIRHHPPARRRTIFCNRLRCWGRYGLAVPSFWVQDALAACYDLLRIAIAERDRAGQLNAIARGIVDAARR